MAEAGPAMKEIVKNQAAQQQADVASKGKASGKGKGTGKEKEVSLHQEYEVCHGRHCLC